jgi:hypothetical protein
MKIAVFAHKKAAIFYIDYLIKKSEINWWKIAGISNAYYETMCLWKNYA